MSAIACEAHRADAEHQRRAARRARFQRSNIDPTNNSPLPDNFLRPIVGYANINLLDDVGVSNYDSMQLTVDRRFTKGISYSASYTLSVTRDTAGTIPLYHDLMSYLYDYAGTDQRHVVTINYVQLPGSHWQNTLARAILTTGCARRRSEAARRRT